MAREMFDVDALVEKLAKLSHRPGTGERRPILLGEAFKAIDSLRTKRFKDLPGGTAFRFVSPSELGVVYVKVRDSRRDEAIAVLNFSATDLGELITVVPNSEVKIAELVTIAAQPC